MAFENLFVRTNRSIAGIRMDAVVSEAHSNEVRITKNPVEFGADIADNAIIEPIKLNIVGQVTDTPLGFAAVGQIIETTSKLFGSSTAEGATRSITAYQAFVALKEMREPIDIQTRLKLYTNMLITNIDVIQDKDSSRMVELRMSFEEIRITNTQVREIERDQLRQGSPQEQGSPVDSRGKQSGKEPSSSVRRSVLRSITDWSGLTP